MQGGGLVHYRHNNKDDDVTRKFGFLCVIVNSGITPRKIMLPLQPPIPARHARHQAPIGRPDNNNTRG
eukprot:scaffold4374_cov84-Skeletonema_dohrnii-CCMP3373.AAC.8